MGWVMLILLSLAAGLLLWATGFPRRLWTIPATAMTLAASGYAWQGNPGLAGAAPRPPATTGEIDPGLARLRIQMFGQFNQSWQYFAAADAMTRAGNRQAAAVVMLGGANKSPQDNAMWTGLGYALAESDALIVSPASRMAFDRAMAMAPRHPGPPYFLALALNREGLAYGRLEKIVEARTFLARAVALSPQNAPWRPDMVTALAGVDQLLAEVEAARRAGPSPSPSPTPSPN